jgi:hypothetical protein
MANTAVTPLTVYVIGDGQSLSAVVPVSPTYSSVVLISAFDSLSNDVTANILSTTLSGSVISFTFAAVFSGEITIYLNLGSLIFLNKVGVLTQPVASTDLSGSSVEAQLLANQQAIIGRLTIICYALGRLIGEYLVPDPTALD